MTPLRYAAIALALFTAAPLCAHAQAAEAHDDFQLGIALNRFQDDFGTGVVMSTPSFAHDRIRFTLGGGMAWYPYATAGDNSQEWQSYGHLRVVVEAGQRLPNLPIRLYGFGGSELLFLPSALSSNPLSAGGIGGFGFEVYGGGAGRRSYSYFVELGGVGTGARADKLPGKPILGNGFDATVGARFYL